MTDKAELYQEAMKFAKEKASISYVQRKCRCSYNDAERMLEQMVSDGVLSTYNGRKGGEAVGAGGVQALSAAPVGWKLACWANINKQGDVTHTQNKQGSWARTALYARTAIAASPTPPAEQPAAPKAAPGEPIKRGKWVWLPLEPTTGMLVAGNHGQPGDFSALKVWQDMIAALDRSADYTRPLDPPTEEAPGEPMVEVTKQDANNYCLILRELGMEEEGDPVAEVRRLAAAPQQEAQEPVAWYEYNADLDAWFLAYSHNPKAKTRPLVFADTAPQPAPAPLSERDGWLSQDDMTALKRVDECFEDGQDYDVAKAQMKRLAELGVVQSMGFAKYYITSFGRFILGSDHLRKPLETVDECNARLGREHHARRAALVAQGGQ